MTMDNVTVAKESSQAGSQVNFKGEPVKLYPGKLKLGDNFVDLAKGTDIDFQFGNKVTIVSIVPSIDTPVCELQTHKLDGAKDLGSDVDVVTISRDLPMAQNRFTKSCQLKNIKFYSDYKSGAFGKKSGLMMQGKELLARAIVVLDKKGVVKYVQVVPEITHFPDLDKAIQAAKALVKG
jgi:thiol peroxidase